MKLLADLFPVLLFFVAYQLYDIYVATGVAIAASVLQVGYLFLRGRKIENTHWMTLGLLVVFGEELAFRDGEGDAAWHGVTGIDYQVHEDLFYLSRVGLDRPKILGQPGYQFDILADDALQHAAQVANNLVQL